MYGSALANAPRYLAYPSMCSSYTRRWMPAWRAWTPSRRKCGGCNAPKMRPGAGSSPKRRSRRSMRSITHHYAPLRNVPRGISPLDWKITDGVLSKPLCRYQRRLPARLTQGRDSNPRAGSWFLRRPMLLFRWFQLTAAHHTLGHQKRPAGTHGVFNLLIFAAALAADQQGGRWAVLVRHGYGFVSSLRSWS